MKPFAVAALLTALLGSSASAQFPAVVGSPPPVVAGPSFGPFSGQPFGAPVYSQYGYITNGYYKSGGVFVGGTGTLPFDSGYYLLGGTEGFARVAGSYRMVPQPGLPGNGIGCPGCAGPAGYHP